MLLIWKYIISVITNESCNMWNIRWNRKYVIDPDSLILEKAMAPHSSTVARKIPWMEEPGRLQPMGSLRVRHDWATSLSLSTFMHWRRKWQPTPVFLPGESQGRVAWWAAVYGVAQSRTRLKRFSSSSTLCDMRVVFKLLFLLESWSVDLALPPAGPILELHCFSLCKICLQGDSRWQ